MDWTYSYNHKACSGETSRKSQTSLQAMKHNTDQLRLSVLIDNSVLTEWQRAHTSHNELLQNVNKIHLKYNATITTLYPFHGLLSRTTWVSRHQKGKPFWILLEQETMGGSHISWTICKSFTGRMPFLPPTNSVKALKAVLSIMLKERKTERKN